MSIKREIEDIKKEIGFSNFGKYYSLIVPWINEAYKIGQRDAIRMIVNIADIPNIKEAQNEH